MLNKSRRKIRQGGKSKGKIVAQGELADGWGTWYVREITASQSENEQCSGQGVRRCSQPTFVKVETPFGEPSKDYLAVLLRSGCSNRGAMKLAIPTAIANAATPPVTPAKAAPRAAAPIDIAKIEVMRRKTKSTYACEDFVGR